MSQLKIQTEIAKGAQTEIAQGPSPFYERECDFAFD
jgi:hypothetical protein